MISASDFFFYYFSTMRSNELYRVWRFPLTLSTMLSDASHMKELLPIRHPDGWNIEKMAWNHGNRQATRWQSSWGQHVAHLGPVGPRWAPCWPREPCYQGRHPNRRAILRHQYTMPLGDKDPCKSQFVSVKGIHAYRTTRDYSAEHRHYR